MLGKLVMEGEDASTLAWSDPNAMNLVAEVSVAAPAVYNPGGSPRVCAVDCGLKMNQVGTQPGVGTTYMSLQGRKKYI